MYQNNGYSVDVGSSDCAAINDQLNEETWRAAIAL